MTYSVHPGVDVLIIRRNFGINRGIEIMKLGKDRDVCEGHSIEDKSLFSAKQLFQALKIYMQLLFTFLLYVGGFFGAHHMDRLE